tara:strand:- start:29 stop:541 length:513 start_codon:yes stop_codon:yes gene_type:complete
MSWNIFRTKYKNGLDNQEDMSKVISDAYDLCVKTGGAVISPIPALGNKDGLKTMLSACFASQGVIPFGKSLDDGLKLYWTGAVAGTATATPGITTAYVKKDNKDLDEFISQLIECFNTYHKQILFTIPGAPPIPGYVVKKETDSDDGGEPDSAERTRGTDPEDETDDKDF